MPRTLILGSPGAQFDAPGTVSENDPEPVSDGFRRIRWVAPCGCVFRATVSTMQAYPSGYSSSQTWLCDSHAIPDDYDDYPDEADAAGPFPRPHYRY